VTEVDLDGRTLLLECGERLAFDELVVTTPLPGFLRMLRGDDEASAAAGDLEWSVVACLNLGVERTAIARGLHWIYFPDEEVPFYRAGFPSNFSDAVAPAGTSSIYVEFGLRREEPLDAPALERSALAALRREGILERDDRILVRDWVRIDPGYVVFDRARQDVLARIVPRLRKRGVHLIGRYGAWTYSYMERALLDGLELAAELRRSGALPTVPSQR
jgi:protoporphyrinogen oxidase